MRRKPNLSKRMELAGRYLENDPGAQKGAWRDILGSDELHIELGCGKGRFTSETAAASPDIMLVALERVADALIIAMERSAGPELPNVRFILGDAGGLRGYFADGEADVIYINFCDPWPQRKKAARRLTSEGFLDIYKSVLKTGGRLIFKTDDVPLFNFSIKSMEACGFEILDVTCDLHRSGVCGIMTDYEAKFAAEGKPICRLVSRR